MKFKVKLRNKVFKPAAFAAWATPCVKAISDSRIKKLLDDKGVLWEIGRESGACSDHMEMSGFQSSSILCAGKNTAGKLLLHRHITIPGLRILPNDTSGSFCFNFSNGVCAIKVNGKTQSEYPQKMIMRGDLTVISDSRSAEITRKFINCADAPALIEKVSVCVKSNCILEIGVPFKKKTLGAEYCVGKEIDYAVCGCSGDSVSFERAYDFKTKQNMRAKESYTFYMVYFAGRENTVIDVKAQMQQRGALIESMFSAPLLSSGNKYLDAEFSHCLLRGQESIYKTKSGLFHSPGGGNYYAALWTNDQCEYANPFFPYSGYAPGIESALNCYRQYEKYMDKSDTPFEKKRALVTSIIAEGEGYWNGAKDRGDGAMYAYGICRFLLALGKKDLFEAFFDNIKWCLDFCLSRKNESGVISSDSDELENRFESGNANLNTSCLTYDALLNGALICEILGKNELADEWKAEAETLKENIERYFGSNVEDFDTYAYYKGNTLLRSWICTPLTVEIFDRKDETLKALFSSKLYKNGTLRSVSNHATTWDRSLLYALRGAFLADYQYAFKEVCAYSENRLLGNHSPYPFEAFPEGNRAHLSGESILFCRIITEGLFGLKVTGMKKLQIAPKAKNISLSGLHLFGIRFDISEKNGIMITVNGKEHISASKTAVFDFEAMQFCEA